MASETGNGVQAIVGCLAYLAGIDADRLTKRRLLIEKLAEIIAADAWFWAVVARATPGKLPTFSVLMKGGFSDERFAKYMQAQEHPDMIRFNGPLFAEMSEKQTHLTRLRQQLDPEGDFPRSKVYTLWKAANLGPLIFSVWPKGDREMGVAAFFRDFDCHLFEERERWIVHVLLADVAWLHDKWEDGPHDAMRDLPPRLHTVTNLLLQGMSRKLIAGELNISIHTVNDYVKDIFRRFETHSTGELIQRFRDGGGRSQGRR